MFQKKADPGSHDAVHQQNPHRVRRQIHERKEGDTLPIFVVFSEAELIFGISQIDTRLEDINLRHQFFAKKSLSNLDAFRQPIRRTRSP